MVVVGRGIEFATARELPLKLKETCRVAAEALTATDLAHGPVAALDQLFPVWAIASDDAMLPSVVTAVAHARASGAVVIASGNAAARMGGAAERWQVSVQHQVPGGALRARPARSIQVRHRDTVRDILVDDTEASTVIDPSLQVLRMERTGFEPVAPTCKYQVSSRG
jgi:hypothetical protein